MERGRGELGKKGEQESERECGVRGAKGRRRQGCMGLVWRVRGMVKELMFEIKDWDWNMRERDISIREGK